MGYTSVCYTERAQHAHMYVSITKISLYIGTGTRGFFGTQLDISSLGKLALPKKSPLAETWSTGPRGPFSLFLGDVGESFETSLTALAKNYCRKVQFIGGFQ